jgi:uncharacterized protein YggE
MRIGFRALLFSSVLSVAVGAAGQPPGADSSRSISVRGRGSVTVAPDAATVSFGMYAREREVRQAKTRCDEILGGVLRLAKEMGIPESSIRTSAILVTPQYSTGPSPEFVGYDVTREITLELADLSRLDRVVDGAIAAGANRDFSVALKSSKEESLRKEALGKAIEDAKERARFAAGRLGAAVGPVRTISLDQGGVPISPVGVRYATLATGGQGRFLPGTITVDAQIDVVFALEPGEKPPEK